MFLIFKLVVGKRQLAGWQTPAKNNLQEAIYDQFRLRPVLNKRIP